MNWQVQPTDLIQSIGSDLVALLQLATFATSPYDITIPFDSSINIARHGERPSYVGLQVSACPGCRAHISNSFNQHVLVDTTPMPDSIPKVPEIGSTSAPLLSASYFIGDRCRPYNDDYMLCKTESYGKGELECMREGRKVTRCAASVYVKPWDIYRKRARKLNHCTVYQTSTPTAWSNSETTGNAWRTTTTNYGNAEGRRGG